MKYQTVDSSKRLPDQIKNSQDSEIVFCIDTEGNRCGAYYDYVNLMWHSHRNVVEEIEYWIEEIEQSEPKQEDVRECETCKYESDDNSHNCNKCDDSFCMWEPKQMTAEEFIIEKRKDKMFKESIDAIDNSIIIMLIDEYIQSTQANVPSEEEIEKYAEFCIVSDREGLPALKYTDWKEHLINKEEKD